MSPGDVPEPTGVTLVLGTSAGGIGAHVGMLAAGLSQRGTTVTVAGPPSADERFAFSSQPGVTFAPVQISAGGRPGDLATISRLRRLLLRSSGLASQAPGQPVDVVHAHGLRAGALTVLALEREHGVARPRIVVTAHNAPPAGPLGGGAAGLVYRALERVVAHGADLVLCVSPDLESRMRSAGARHVAQAVIAAPAPAEPSPAGKRLPRGTGPGRPVVLAAGRLAPQKGFDVLLSAAARWRDLDPPPLVLIAGEGPLAKKLRAQAVELDVPAVFLGHHDDVPALLASAAVFVLPSRWEGQPLVLQEALRAGAPIVATKAGGIPALAGEDTVLLVPPDDVDALDDAVRSVLTDPALSFALTAAARTRAATLPTEKDAVEAALTAYTRIPG